MEEEIKIGEQEREHLRIEAQRLREELSDLKIEAEILQDKLKKQDERHMSATLTDLSIPASPMFDSSIVSGAMSGASSPLIGTPPESSSVCSVKTPVNEPPSPPMSDASAPPPRPPIPKARVPSIKTPAPPGASRPKKSRLPSMDTSVTPRPRLTSSASSRPPTRSTTNSMSRTNTAPRTNAAKPPARTPANKLAPSTSLSHIRSLTAQMQRLEARVQSARSKLPAPVPTPPRASPRGSVLGHNSNVTVRSRKRGPSSVYSAATSATDDSTPTGQNFNKSANGGNHVPRLSMSGVSRLSFGPLPNRGPVDQSETSRPSSRASNSSFARPGSRADGRYDGSMIAPPRPGSRAGNNYTPLGRPISRASFGNSLHGHSMSYSTAEEEEPVDADREYKTPSRRGTYSRTGLPTPSGLPMPNSRRQSLASVTSDAGLARRASVGVPKLRKKPSMQAPDLGETY